MEKPFELTAVPANGTVPSKVVNELVHLKELAKDSAKIFSDAVDRQAKAHRVKKGALKRYVTAVEADTLPDLSAETASLDALLGAR